MRAIDADLLKKEMWSDYQINDMFYPNSHEDALKIVSNIIDSLPTVEGKAQEPRVMTLDEVKAMDRLTYCVIEPHSKVIKNTFNAEYRGIVAIGTDNFLDFGLYADTNPYRRTEAGYNKTWRCWTSRPTDEQRKVVKWDE